MQVNGRGTSGSASDGRRGGALLVIMSAAIAALVAHIGIDIAGDYLLVRDSYDGVAHGSRLLVAAGMLAAIGTIALRLMSSALDRVVGPRGTVRAYAGPVLPRSPGRYFAAAIVATFVLLIGMERVDLFLANSIPDDLADLLGGSLALGIALTLPIALTTAAIGLSIARWIAVARLTVFEVVCTWMLSRARHIGGLHAITRRSRRPVAVRPAFARNATKRGPPLRESFG